MKSVITAVLAAATFATPLASNVASADPPRHHRGDWDRGDRGRDRDWRDDRRNDRWDHNRYNGYYRGSQWYYGPPPAYYSDYRPGWHDWRRGDRLPSYYRSRYSEVDWRYHHLRPPPRGYHYVRDDRGAYLLVGIATGVILGAILNDNY
ncbi:MAG TPA: RcnB family protein [Caulobacterales bacterium]|nr:RcnB family protein [Caulobacterales bacterium]